MLPETSKVFLDKCKHSGMKFDEVAGQLAQGGWSPDQLELAKSYFETNEILPPTNSEKPVSQEKPETEGREPKKEKRGTKIAIFAAFGLIFLLVATGVPAYFVATEKLNFGNQAFKEGVAKVIFSIPFIPKTPKYILQSAIDAHKKLLKNSFDISFAAKSNDFRNMIGADNLDAQMKGYSDFSDTKNPKFSLTLNITKDFSAMARKNDKMVYVKIDKFPPAVTTLLGVDPDKLNSVLENWMAYDATPLETEARKNLDSISQTGTPANEELTSLLTKMLNEQILPQIKVSNDKVDKFGTYKLEFVPSATSLDKIGDEIQQEETAQIKKNYPGITGPTTINGKLSDQIKNLDVTVWIDSSLYYVRKGTVTFSYNPATNPTTPTLMSDLPVPTSVSSPVTVSLAIQMSDFGSNVRIELPAKSLTPEDMYKQIMENSNLIKAIDPTRQYSEANNTKRRSDIYTLSTAISQYTADHKGNLPPGIGTTPKNINNTGANICSALVPDYMAALPSDPLTNKGDSIKTCTGIYDTGYTILKVASSGRVTISAPEAELGEVISVTR
jgi:type IV pilus assembly protein PilA